MPPDRLPNALAAVCAPTPAPERFRTPCGRWEYELANVGHVAAEDARLTRDAAAAALADDRDGTVVPMPARLRLPFERATRWVVLDARKLPSPQPASP